MNKRIALSGMAILTSLALIGGATFAFFSDTETSTGNTLAAGEIDLKIDNESYYNGVLNEGTTWLTATDLTNQLFFNFDDIKPNDYGEDTISVHVDSNDSWVCADVTLRSDDDNGLTEPEGEDGDTTGGADQGELADAVNFLWWADDGDNVLETDETVLPGGPLGALDIDETATVALADSQTNIWGTPGDPFTGGETRHIGKAWCFGTIGAAALPVDDYTGPDADNNADTVAGTPADGGISCDGSALNNTTQTDSLTADISFRAVQSRNNGSFVCTVPASAAPSVAPSASPSTSPSPLPSAI